MNLINELKYIFLGTGLIIIFLNIFTKWAMKTAQDPYEWEREMKAIFCEDHNSNPTLTEEETSE